MNWLALAADAPPDLSTWIGSLVLTSAATALVSRLFTRGDKDEAARKTADAEWRAEIRGDLKRLIDGQSSQGTVQQLQAKDLATLAARVDGIDKRQEAQASAHKEAVAALRAEFAK